jgi:hypothetical protein
VCYSGNEATIDDDMCNGAKPTSQRCHNSTPLPLSSLPLLFVFVASVVVVVVVCVVPDEADDGMDDEGVNDCFNTVASMIQ